MKKLILILFICSLFSCDYTEIRYKKPFIIIGKQKDNVCNRYYYLYQDSIGKQNSFYEQTEKYNIGDTIK